MRAEDPKCYILLNESVAIFEISEGIIHCNILQTIILTSFHLLLKFQRGFVEAHADDGYVEIFGLKHGWHASMVMVELISAKHIAQVSHCNPFRYALVAGRSCFTLLIRV